MACGFRARQTRQSYADKTISRMLGMRQIYRLIVILLLLLLSTVGVIRIAGEHEYGSFALLFANADGSPCQRPCLLGIRPGDMTFDAAVALLKVHPVTRDLQFQDINYRMNLFNGRGLTVTILKTPGGKVASIGVQFFPSRFFPSDSPVDASLPASPVRSATYGDVVSMLGAPSTVYTTTNSDAIWSYFYSDRLIIGTTLSAPPSQVSRIEVADSVDFITLVANRQFQPPSGLARWFGFGSVGHYATLAEGLNPLDP